LREPRFALPINDFEGGDGGGEIVATGTPEDIVTPGCSWRWCWQGAGR
jgi:hypothetical protein